MQRQQYMHCTVRNTLMIPHLKGGFWGDSPLLCLSRALTLAAFRTCFWRVCVCLSHYSAAHVRNKLYTNLPRTPISVSWTMRASIKLAAFCFPSSLVNSRMAVGRPKHRDAVSTWGDAGQLLQPVNARSWPLLVIPEINSLLKIHRWRYRGSEM